MNKNDDINYLKQIWLDTVLPYSPLGEESIIIFKNIQSKYSQKNRAYHNLAHLVAMFKELGKYKEKIENIPVISFSIFFHDIIYKSLRKDNEEKSADEAVTALKTLGLSNDSIKKCQLQILSTKKHEPLNGSGNDCNFLIDFDLEILSRDWLEYKLYTQQIRKEYSLVPAPLYRSGRKKAMLQFIKRDYIYQTDFYRNEKEEKARENILREIALL